MTTVQTLIDEVRGYLNETTSSGNKFWEDTEIINYFKRSINELSFDTSANYRTYEYTVATGSTITNVTAATSAVVTVTNTHTLKVGDKVEIAGITGDMGTDVLNDNVFTISAVTSTTMTINADTTGKTYTSGGTVDLRAVLFTTLTAGVESKLFDHKFILFRDKDWATDTWDDLNIVSPLDNRIFVSNNNTVVTAELYDDKLEFNRKINTNDKIVVSGRWKKTDITTGTDTYPLDSESESASVAYATALGFYKKRVFDAGDRWLAQWERRKRSIKERTERLIKPTAPAGMTMRKRTTTIGDSIYPIQTVSI